MKKINFYFFMMMITIILIAFSCNKHEVVTSIDLLSDTESNDDSKQNLATWVSSSENNSKFWFLKIIIRIGHTASDCGNKCVKIFGEQGHVDCRGVGNVCNRIVDAQMIQNEGGIVLVLLDNDAFGEDLDFLIPDRCLYITNPLNNTDLWLNIPEQVLLRDNNGVPFEILNVWFSENPELENK